MDVDYSGAVGLAQAVLAVNLAYLGLNKFRYKVELRDMFRQALTLIDGMPPHYKEDLAWKNIESIAEGGVPQAWTGGRVGHWLYVHVFERSRDRSVCLALAILAALLLIIEAFTSMVSATEVVVQAEIAVRWTVFLLLLTGIAMPPIFISTGQYMIRIARESMKDGLAHLGARFRDDGGEDISAKLQAWGLEP